MFTPKFNIGALVMVATNPVVYGTIVGFYKPKPSEEPQYSVKNRDTLQNTWYNESDLRLPQPEAPKETPSILQGVKFSVCNDLPPGVVVLTSHESGKNGRLLNELSAAMARMDKLKESTVDKAAREYREACEEQCKAHTIVNNLVTELRAAKELLKQKNDNARDKSKAFYASAKAPQPPMDIRY